jgi:hypothetical protein
MRFPNLVWATNHRGMPHYRLAAAANMSESYFSRRLHGRGSFTTVERKRISEVLGFAERWLFSEPVPAALTESETVETTSPRTAGDA